MSKKHFEVLAEALRTSKPKPVTVTGREERVAPAQWRYDVEMIAEACEESSPRFDRARFFAACGYEETPA